MIKWSNETRLVSELKEWAKNPRIIAGKKFDDLITSMDKFGYVDQIVINTDGELIGGHARLMKLKQDGVKEVSVRAPERRLSEGEFEELAIRLNKNIAGEWDFDALIKGFDQADLIDWGFDLGDFPDITNPEGATDPDEVPDIPEEPKSRPGDLYILGNHRLLCGDSTNIQDVEKLMDGEKADMVFTDPPYGVNYEGKTKDKLKIKNDKMSEPELADFISSVFNCVDVVIRPGAYLLATVPAGQLHIHFISDWKNRGWLRQILVWNKDSMVLGHSEYHYKHEPILFGWKEGDRLKSNDRTKTSVWDFARPKRSKEHPTMKPVEMWEYGINNHSIGGGVIYEPFGGSGTTLIACEKTNRKCRTIELDPKYCDVIIKRWQDYTQKQAIHQESGKYFNDL